MPSPTAIATIGPDPAYPIFHVSARWHDDKCPEGGHTNGTGFHTMYRVHPSLGMVAADARIWWQKYAKGKVAPNNPRQETIKVSLFWWETWCPGWFSHHTFDVGLDDAGVLASFQRYVDRTQDYNRQHSRIINDSWQEPLCLMGAEDRWRWCGTADEKGNRTDPPCRCEHCRKAGILIIGH